MRSSAGTFPGCGSSRTSSATRGWRSRSRGASVGDHGLKDYLVVYGTARVTEGGAPELLQRLARTYLGSDSEFPPMPNPPPGYITHIAVDRIAGAGPWAQH